MPRRFAALAVCLLALAAGASAACTEGSIQMSLVTADPSLAGSDIAKCLSTATVSIDVDCKISLAAATDNAFVPALWSSDSGSYKQFKLCPSASSTAVFDSNSAKSIALALNGYVYGFSGTTPLKSSGVTAVAFPEAGKVVVTIATKELVYAIQSATTSGDIDTNAVVSAGAGLTATTEYQDADNMGEACAAGRYGLIVGSIKLCPLCPAGTSGDGNGCTACSAGYAYGSVGLDSAANIGAGCDAAGNQCAAGYYAQEGSSNCLPCPLHTYSAAGEGECTPCPANTYAWIPGSTTCVTCNDGVVLATTNAQSAGSAGSAILTLDAALTCAAHTGSYAIDMLGKCDLGIGSPTTKLALEVAADCSITIKPIGYAGCSDPGAVNGVLALFPQTLSQNGLDALSKYTYTYNDLTIRAYYASETTIRTLLPSTEGGASSFMLNIDVNDGPSKKVNVAFYAATNKPGESTDPGSKSCTVVATVAGGNLAAISEGTCTPGSYKSSNSCYACPQGQTCASNTATDCTAANANPYLGQTTGACKDCTPDTTRYTSLAGAAYCTVPYFDRNCYVGDPYNAGGYEWDEHAAACVQCQPGTYRSAAMFPGGASPNPECQPCPIGQYSGLGEATCTACPAGQYSPTTGMADQTATTGIKCLKCPVGSIALKDTESMNDEVTIQASDYRNEKDLSLGASQCDACPSGTWADSTKPTKGCSLCASGYYRIGDASAENNKCRQIPPGYKASAVLETTAKTGATAITTCEIGTASSWAAGIRSPTDATICKACDKNTVATRTGMAACTACKGGWEPNPGFTACTQCAAGTYRSFYTANADCADCAAGSEVGPSGRQACTLCRPGYYKTTSATTDYCSECPINKYQATPGATSACSFCPKGKETRDTGNSACDDCAIGYYNPKTATQSDTPACIPAPAGTYVNTTGAFFATQCPLGTYNGQTGQDSCEPCAPGSYTNTLGNKVCKTCPAGTYSGGQAATCKACAAGFYAPAGSGACSPCKPGTYTSDPRSGTCKLCPKGKQCPTPATVTPRNCPAGSYSSKDGSVLCTPCPVNSFASIAGLTKCTPCASGTNTRGLTGQKACTAVRVTSLRRSVL
ncbi:von Willebrand factor type EGF andpentraxin domain-containing 1 Flags: Precursor [Chlorella sorokiniana]|uniref:von Willebrand factor type EGF andpentraxin domain-containing 1 Flags n=1 Tax=Chlorella sorokiniana TaxID=3076 RepID=A0A2P6TYU9_CHLSO|nr:von Willebrand factor type EGF andpentraxin domain-containing 1 Flags: Precursor [Chlorella sorokiniana]|eukprot:PRW59245.1 von Willebrand factor type EGF andpentraxin domain-containing 1 Flags: Precursor [Chlorella sorokiniana]